MLTVEMLVIVMKENASVKSGMSETLAKFRLIQRLREHLKAKQMARPDPLLP